MMYSMFARLVAFIGDIVVSNRHKNDQISVPALGKTPSLPSAKPQGIPTLKMPTARGWVKGQTPEASPGLVVNAFASNLKHPRWIQVMPNGDVLLAEALSVAGPPNSLFDLAMISTMKRAAALGDSPNRITLLRDTDGDGMAS
jgi:glucose/arabinose dehydrogenase